MGDLVGKEKAGARFFMVSVTVVGFGEAGRSSAVVNASETTLRGDHTKSKMVGIALIVLDDE